MRRLFAGLALLVAVVSCGSAPQSAQVQPTQTARVIVITATPRPVPTGTEIPPAMLANTIAALRKLDAATDVGVSYEHYGPLLVDAQALVNETLPDMHESELRTEISAAMEGYADAYTVWGLYLDKHDLVEGKEPGAIFITKYNLPIAESTVEGYGKFIYSGDALTYIWQATSRHVARITALRP